MATHSRSVPQTYPPRPQHAHSSPARVHSTTEPRLRTTLLSRCGPCLNTRWSVFNLKTILLLAKHGNNNVDKGGDIHGIREWIVNKSQTFRVLPDDLTIQSTFRSPTKNRISGIQAARFELTFSAPTLSPPNYPLPSFSPYFSHCPTQT